ncbi:EpsG family protein [Enterococcus malodoratus]|uniref:EpsG family protein n=1 Tax=Enterococcus malodoratus TaxID=71451 RepID=UPI0008AACC0F|nr:EpsG family protein [Enterococcus malodoratus]SES96546.1 EpsG family protein [Enterococcus malodoratus]
MKIYLYTIAVSVFFALISDIVYRKVSGTAKKVLTNFFMFLSFIPPFLIGALRYNIGIDYSVYTNNQIPQVLSGWDKFFNVAEPFFQIIIKSGNELNSFLGSFAMNTYQWVFVITQLIIVGAIFISINSLSPYRSLSVLIFYFSTLFFSGMNIMRQTIGLSFIFLGLMFIESKKYFILTSFAFLSHKSSIIYFPMYLLSKINYRKFWLLLIPLLAGLFANALRIIMYFISGLISNRYDQYFSNIMDDGVSAFGYVILHYLVLAILIYSFKKVKPNRLTNFLLYAQVASASIACAYSSLPNAFRIISFCQYFTILSIPIALKMISDRKRRAYLMISIIILYVAFFSNWFFGKDISQYVPYKDVFGNFFY